MAQVRDVVRDALGHLGVLDANQAVSAIDMRDAIRALNLMMRRWEANGLALGWSDVEEPTDTLPLPPEAEEAVGFNLAVRLRPRYRVALDADAYLAAGKGLDALRRDRMVASPLTFDRRGTHYNTLTDAYE